MKNFNKTLASPDSIEVKTYYKNKNTGVCSSENVYVASINVPAGTVNAKIGASAAYKDYPKEVLFRYINFFGYSD